MVDGGAEFFWIGIISARVRFSRGDHMVGKIEPWYFDDKNVEACLV